MRPQSALDRRQDVDERLHRQDTRPAFVPGTVWGTASKQNCQVMVGAVLALNSGKLSGRRPPRSGERLRVAPDAGAPTTPLVHPKLDASFALPGRRPARPQRHLCAGSRRQRYPVLRQPDLGADLLVGQAALTQADHLAPTLLLRRRRQTPHVYMNHTSNMGTYPPRSKTAPAGSIMAQQSGVRHGSICRLALSGGCARHRPVAKVMPGLRRRHCWRRPALETLAERAEPADNNV